jgi:threonine dehydrogenase-like Zn-dependent dehydrogenase
MTTTAPTMPAAVFADIGKLELVERPVPRLRRPGDVLLDVQSSGICGTDLHILSTPPGFEATPGTVLGHEFVGVVRGAGADVMSLAPGDRVVVAPNVSCGQCSSCRRGLRNHCENFTTHGVFIDGGLAPHVVVPASQCFPIGHHPSGTPLPGSGQMSSSMRSVPSCRTRSMWFERPVASSCSG